MDSEEITKLVDGIYKNILEKFNPGARQLINAGKSYLKALHGASAAAKLYIDAITKLAKQAHQGALGGSSDIGSALTQMVEVYKEIQNQQLNILKAFYVDLLAPLESNLEKDIKVVQMDQKRFLQQQKQRFESYNRAANNVKKHRKKNRSSKSSSTLEKELHHMQILEEERTALEGFCEESLKHAITQERRRYGFVLERQCSLAKHYVAYHSKGNSGLQRHLEDWQETARSREVLPESPTRRVASRLRGEEDIYSTPQEIDAQDEAESTASKLRKTKSMDASCLDAPCMLDLPSPPRELARAKSDFNLNSSMQSLHVLESGATSRPKSMVNPKRRSLARGLYAYLSSGENQMSFLEGDMIALVGEQNKGWQYGENLRTQRSGWFPVGYTELLPEGDDCTPAENDRPIPCMTSFATANRPVTMFGDTLQRCNQPDHPKIRPVVTPIVPDADSDISTVPTSTPPPPPPPPAPAPSAIPPDLRVTGNISLHSSNDSGFGNDANPPPQPEIDYSDSEENSREDGFATVKLRRNRPAPALPETKRSY